MIGSIFARTTNTVAAGTNRKERGGWEWWGGASGRNMRMEKVEKGCWSGDEWKIVFGRVNRKPDDVRSTKWFLSVLFVFLVAVVDVVIVVNVWLAVFWSARTLKKQFRRSTRNCSNWKSTQQKEKKNANTLKVPHWNSNVGSLRAASVLVCIAFRSAFHWMNIKSIGIIYGCSTASNGIGEKPLEEKKSIWIQNRI